jgi:hypothetical protein
MTVELSATFQAVDHEKAGKSAWPSCCIFGDAWTQPNSIASSSVPEIRG